MSTIRKIGGFAEPCRTCRWAGEGGWCQNGASKNYDLCESDGKIGTTCPDWEAMECGEEPEDDAKNTALALLPETSLQLHQDVKQMGEMILQLGTMIGTMQRRMDELEERQAAVTVSHADVKRIQALIRSRADEICGKYGLEDPESRKVFRAAIKKDVLRRCAAADLHDIPQAMRGAVDRQIDGWTNIRLVMERRERP